MMHQDSLGEWGFVVIVVRDMDTLRRWSFHRALEVAVEPVILLDEGFVTSQCSVLVLPASLFSK